MSVTNSPLTPAQEQQLKQENGRRLSQQQNCQTNGSPRNIAGSSSRQPIHTPLISNQPVITVNTPFIIIHTYCVFSLQPKFNLSLRQKIMHDLKKIKKFWVEYEMEWMVY